MRPWILALLDNAPIETGSLTQDQTDDIATPPKYNPSATAERGAKTTSARARSLRSASPSKMPPPEPALNRKIASPKKSRLSRAARATSQSSAAADAAHNEDSVEPESVDGDNVRVTVTSTVEEDAETETTHTKVKVALAPGTSLADFALPDGESAEEMVAKAKAMVEEATRRDGRMVNGTLAPARSSRKRTMADIEEEDGEELEGQPVSKTRRLEEELKEERVQKRAFIGLSAMLAIG